MLISFRAFLLTLLTAAPVQAADVTVFAAASLGDALGDLAETWESETGHTTTLVFAGSATLARQIEAGAPADVFVSANVDWMEWLDARGRLIPDSQLDIASNRLVLIAGSAQLQSDLPVTSETDLDALLGSDGRLAIALPDAVPVGIYAKAALSKLEIWDDVSQRLAPTDNARAALALVALGETPVGLVYATDALAEPRVHVVGVFPPDTHPTIRYPAAMIAETNEAEASAAFLRWLGSDPAQAILAVHGFLPPGSDK